VITYAVVGFSLWGLGTYFGITKPEYRVNRVDKAKGQEEHTLLPRDCTKVIGAGDADGYTWVSCELGNDLFAVYHRDHGEGKWYKTELRHP